MSTLHHKFNFTGHVKIVNETTGEILLDADNSIHSQNMARIIARGLSNEDNSIIYRMAFGDGGTFVNADGDTVFHEPNDGRPHDGLPGDGWESRLYHETFSEVIDESSGLFGTDPGSAGPDSIRVGGGARSQSDPPDPKIGTISAELGKKSKITITMYLNENEPAGTVNPFMFNEIGLYSPGLGAIATPAATSVNVGDKYSTDSVVPPLTPFGIYSIGVDVDGSIKEEKIQLPASGSGPAGVFTYGDVCEGLNTGAWVQAGDNLSASVHFFITDLTAGQYPSIVGEESFGFLTAQSKITGSSSSIGLSEIDPILGETNLMLLLGDSSTDNVNVNGENGKDVGVRNDSVNTEIERERLLSHLIFTPIYKPLGHILKILYTITAGVADETTTSITGIPPWVPAASNTPSPSPTPTPSPTPAP